VYRKPCKGKIDQVIFLVENHRINLQFSVIIIFIWALFHKFSPPMGAEVVQRKNDNQLKLKLIRPPRKSLMHP